MALLLLKKYDEIQRAQSKAELGLPKVDFVYKTTKLLQWVKPKTATKILDVKINPIHFKTGKYYLATINDVTQELEEQKELIKDSSEKLKRLLDDYIKTNKFDEYIDSLENLSEKRHKNAYEKRKIMKLLDDKTLSEPEIGPAASGEPLLIVIDILDCTPSPQLFFP